LSDLLFLDDPANARCRRRPVEPFLTGYDMNHLVTYLRLLDADADGADRREAARIVLRLDVKKDPDRTKRVWRSHLARAKWMTTNGFKHLLRGGAPH
jgi:Uncharacterized conserved protein (DUF2285)